MIDKIRTLAHALEDKIIAYRRDFHKYAEAGWQEFRTVSLVARRLVELGYDIRIGPEVIKAEARMGLPDAEVLEANWQRAIQQNGDPEFLNRVRGGFTGAVGVLSHGDGPTVALRFDMDALELQESDSQHHRPVREGFASVNAGVMHACGHDGHTAIGLGLAEVLAALKDKLQGSVKLVFQPAEEGVRGAKSMVAAGVVDDVDYMLGQHLYSGWPPREIAGGARNYLATRKFDAFFQGEAAHAGASPQAGKNALLSAVVAVSNLYAIPRHQQGATRINVGRMVAGTARNIIPAHAHLVIETRGMTTELNEYMYAASVRALESAAAMYNCDLSIVQMGAAQSADSDPTLAECVEKLALDLGGFTVRRHEGGGGSEDYTYMMLRVQEHGGLATNISIGADLGGWGHHTSEFDIDESVLKDVVALLSMVTLDLMGKG